MKPPFAAIAFVCLAMPAFAEQPVQSKKTTEVAVARTTKVEPAKPVEDSNLNTSGRSIMRLSEDVVVRGRPCKRGWLRLHPNGVPSSFTTSREIKFGKLTIPADTWVMQNENSLVLMCALPRDMEIQGVLCRGTGGAKGVQVEVYPSGALKRVFLAQDAVIQGVPCSSGLVSGAVDFQEDGRLKSCKLSDAYTFAGVTYKKGARLELSAVGGENVASK